VPGWQLPWPDPTSTVTSTVDRFYLRELLTCPCGGLMLPTIRIDTRFYISGDGCRRRVDAIAVETEVWQRVSRLRPTVCDPALPDDLRHVLLATLLTRIELGPHGLTFRLRWKSPGTTQVHAPPVGHRCEERR
jgi:hypothetical protein